MIRMYQHSMILIEFYQNICRLNLIILSCPGSVFFFLNVGINLGDAYLVGVGVLKHLKKNSVILLQSQT